MTAPASSPSIRAAADALVGHVRDTVDADNGIQVKITQNPDQAKKRVWVQGPDGEQSLQPFSPDYTPNVGELAWLTGPSGSKMVTHRVGGRAPVAVADVGRQEVWGDHRTTGSATVGGNHSTTGSATVGGNHSVAGDQSTFGHAYTGGNHDVDGGVGVGQGMTVWNNGIGTRNRGPIYADGDIRTPWQVFADLGFNGDHRGNSNGTHYGDQNGNSFGNCNGTHYGDQRGTCFGDVQGNDVGCNHTGCGVGNFGDLSYNRLVPPPSERGLKDEDSKIDGADALAFVLSLDPVRYRLREHLPVGGGVSAPIAAGPPPLQAGLYVNEIADGAPELVVAHENAGGATGWRTYDDRGLTAYVLAALQYVAGQRDELATQVRALTDRVDALTDQPGGAPA